MEESLSDLFLERGAAASTIFSVLLRFSPGRLAPMPSTPRDRVCCALNGSLSSLIVFAPPSAQAVSISGVRDDALSLS